MVTVSLLENVSEICKMKGVKAKVMQDENGKVYIFDCHHWSMECSCLLHFLCPNALMSVESALSSLSHFVIVLHEDDSSLNHTDGVNRKSSSARRMYGAIIITILIYALLIYFHVYDLSYSSIWPFLHDHIIL
jgi:hypothetical protein